ncbi:MAG: hypothetical protein ABIY90_01235 [Puia sp.]
MRNLLWTILLLLANRGALAQDKSIDKTAFYQAMQQDKKDLINSQLKKLKTVSPKIRQAFEGAMIMKKAGTGGSPVTKLNLFKQGHRELEAAIKKEPDNAEFRFLRLIIQENAPGFLGYKDNLEGDSEYIRNSYKSLPGEVQQAIADYSKKSKVLKLQVS